MGDREKIIWAAFGTAILITGDSLTAAQIPSARSYLGLIIATILMLFLAAPAPKVASALMLLLFVAVLINRGPRTLRRLRRIAP